MNAAKARIRRHATYIDADIAGIRRTLEALYTIDEDELDTEVV